MIDLQVSRDKLDVIDKQIVELMEQRLEITRAVAEYKKEAGKPVFDKEREKSKLENLTGMVERSFAKKTIDELFRQIMSISRKLQYSMIDVHSDVLLLQPIADIERDSHTKVAYFGGKGAYTEQAMEEFFGSDIQARQELTFRGVMELVQNGEADYGVLPFENTSTGGITDNFDLLLDYDNTIVGQHIVKVEHALVGLPGAKIEDIRTVYSHPQGLLQCETFFEQHPEIVREEYSSTAASAAKVLEEQDITHGAIASKRAAKYYGLEVLQEAVNYQNENYTRFIIITNKKVYFQNASKVQVCFELPHESGSLYNMLSHFIFNGINMTNIQSRPIIGRKWEYRFFVEFDGNLQDEGVRNAIRGIQEEASSLRILGNY